MTIEFKYLEERLDELRRKYRDTGEAEWRYRYAEARSIADRLLVNQIRGQQDIGQDAGRSAYKPTAGGRLS